MRMFLSVLHLAARDVVMSIATETPTEGKWLPAYILELLHLSGPVFLWNIFSSFFLMYSGHKKGLHHPVKNLIVSV